MIELIIVIALFSIIAVLAAPFYQSLQLKADLNQSGERLVLDLRRQQIYAASGRQASSWGVRFDANSYILFKGVSFASRDPAADEAVSLPESVSLSSPISEVTFTVSNGVASASGQLTLTNLIANQTLVISISPHGLIQLN